jgi:hypothetical protein
MRAAAALLLVASCAAEAPVERAYDGRVVEGRFIEPAAYAAYLRGALAESAGVWKEAVVAYGRAAELDPRSWEAWWHVGRARCALDGRDPEALAAFARAHALAPAIAPLAASCPRVEGPGATTGPRPPGTTDAPAGLAPGAGAAARDRALASALASHDPAAAWGALAAWSRDRDDVALETMALERQAVSDPSRRREIAARAEALAGMGQRAAARQVAAAAIGPGDDPLPAGAVPLAGRLAVDEAILRGDAAAVRDRATRTRLGLDEAAARAGLLGQPSIARALARERAAADPEDLAAHLVALIAEGSEDAGPHVDPFRVMAAVDASPNARVAAAVWVLVGRALAPSLGAMRARRVVSRLDREPVGSGDETVSRAALALAIAHVVDPGDLSADAAVELAIVQGGLGEPATAPPLDHLDARHRLLALAASDARPAEYAELSARLARIAPQDRVVVAAQGLVRIAADAPLDGEAAAILGHDEGDPLLAAVALRLALETSDATLADKARAALLASAGAPARPTR